MQGRFHSAEFVGKAKSFEVLVSLWGPVSFRLTEGIYFCLAWGSRVCREGGAPWPLFTTGCAYSAAGLQMCLLRARSNGKENGLLSRPSAFPIPVTLKSPSSMHCVCVLWTHGLLSRTGELVTCVSWNLPALETHGLSCWGPLRVTVWLYPKHTWPPNPSMSCTEALPPYQCGLV